ncbi:hypothetical protein [Palleronia caenipelagi]|uniref:Uncharacterized protein n=1 Tax=Palleronia caenipelagi TaxID=2489174 RepID=A0A547Q7A3_9RHOB|nr:hypothetical protein [Palleronia caenipelagi]TRD22265.1 hypothetical protein FEV53_05970 [Palleronia caenipelagi]
MNSTAETIRLLSFMCMALLVVVIARAFYSGVVIWWQILGLIAGSWGLYWLGGRLPDQDE